jgi:hypothetical protein
MIAALGNRGGPTVKRKPSALRYGAKAPIRSTVRRQYETWRRKNDIPLCDNEACHFHKAPLIWNGKPLTLVLDHVEGNKYDNHPKSLRYLCPNCDAQLETRGGKNRGRVTDVTEDGYVINLGGGRKIVAATAKFEFARSVSKEGLK